MQVLSLINLVKKTAATRSNAGKFAHITDPLQRKNIRTIQTGTENLHKLVQNMEDTDKKIVQEFLTQIERYGFSKGELKYIIQEAPDMLQNLETLADKKLIEAVLLRKALLKDGILGYITKDNKKEFIKLFRNKSITDEQIDNIKALITEKNAHIIKQLLKDKNFNQKLLADIPVTHLRSDNVEILKQISKNGNVSKEEMLYIMCYTNKSNSDLAIKLLQKSKKNTRGLNFIISSVYAPAQLSEEGLKAFQLRKNFLSELLEDANFKLGADETGYENFLISKVISVVTPENYQIAKNVLIKHNVNLYDADFLKAITLENKEIAAGILRLASRETRLPELQYINPKAAAKYLDEISRINDPKIRSRYLEVVGNITADNVEDVLQVVKTTKPEDIKLGCAAIEGITYGFKKEELVPVLDAIKQSGRNLNIRDISNICIVVKSTDILTAQIFKRILNNKSIPDNQVKNLIEQYIGVVSRIQNTGFEIPNDIYTKLSKGLLKKDEYNALAEKAFEEFGQKQTGLIKKLPDVLDNLLQNKNLTFNEAIEIFSQISTGNIAVIEKYVLSPKIKNMSLHYTSPGTMPVLEKLADIGVSKEFQKNLLNIIKTTEKNDKKRLEILPELLKRRTVLDEKNIRDIIFQIDDTTIKYADEIIGRQDLSLGQINELLKIIKQGGNADNIMKLVRDKSLKSEYFTQILDEPVFKLYEKNPELVKKALDLKAPLRVFNQNSVSFDAITDVIGEKRFANILKGLEQAKTKYGIAPQEALSLQSVRGANDAFIILENSANSSNLLLFKFDKKTGNLVAISHNGKVINASKGKVVEDYVALDKKINEDIEPFPYYISTVTSGKKGQFGTIYLESAIKGQYDIFHMKPDGSKIRIGHALVTPNGTKHIKRTLTSSDGTKTYFAYREDKKGNSYFHSMITDKTGQKISDVKRTFKVVSKNHFVSTKDGQAYDIVFTDKNVVVTKLDAAGKKTKEKVEFQIKDIPLDDADKIISELKLLDGNKIYKIAEIFKRYGVEPKTIDSKCVELLKRLPGDEWFAMNKSCEFVMPQSVEPMQAFYAGNSIFLSKEFKNNLGVFSHELGHAKFYTLNLGKDKELMKIYNAEKRAYTSQFPESRINSIDYFLQDNNLNKCGLNETAAETNLLTTTVQSWDQIQDRTIFLEQYFPKTIAYLREKYTQLI